MIRAERDRVVGLALLLPVAAALVFSFVRNLGEGWDVPSDDDYRAVRGLLTDAGADGRLGSDAIAVLPPWSVRALSFFGDLQPISADALAERPLDRYRRLFVVVEPDADDHLAALMRRIGAPATTSEVGRLSVLRWDLPAHPVFDLSARVTDATVRLEGKTGLLCDEPLAGAWGSGVHCPGRGDWLRVRREWQLVTENGDLVVWSHPPAPGERLVISWPDVVIGDAVVVRAGHNRAGAERADKARGTVRLRVIVDDEEVGLVERRPSFAIEPTRNALRSIFVGPEADGGQGFRTSIVDTRRFMGGRHRLSFVIDTDADGSNSFLWDAWVRGGVP